MPRRYVIANWKMNLPAEGVREYLDAIRSAPPDPATIVVAPPFLYVRDVAGSAIVAAQNCADHRAGAFTGEISPSMLADAGVEYVILGHSERRHIFGESDALIARKLALAIECGLRPILCVGESREVRDSGRAAVFVADQIKAVAESVKAAVIVAYEPVWAIGTGRNATGAMVAEMVRDIRDAARRFWPSELSADVSILYGGSVNPGNVDDLAAHGNIDGYLVGGACLESDKLLAIHAATQR